MAVITTIFLPWDTVNPFLQTCRDGVAVSSYGTGTFDSTPKETEDEPKEKEEQKINFGQFSRKGEITYNGTIELYVTSYKKFKNEELFLRGFIGRRFQGNTWYGTTTENENDSRGNAFEKEEGIYIGNGFDSGAYVPFSVDQKKYKKMLEKPIGISEESRNRLQKNTMKVASILHKRIPAFAGSACQCLRQQCPCLG